MDAVEEEPDAPGIKRGSRRDVCPAESVLSEGKAIWRDEGDADTLLKVEDLCGPGGAL